MWPQIISSLAAGAALATAAVMLNSPVSLIALAVICMISWLSHEQSFSPFLRNMLMVLGITLGLWLAGYLLFLAI